MPSLVFATSNRHKIREIQQQLGTRYDFLSLDDIGCTEDIAETADTLEGNARQKARYVKDRYGYDCFSEDTGLEVKALDGAPGVHTARYAGPARNADANNAKLIQALRNKEDRSAQFRTVICLIQGEDEIIFEGICKGAIAHEPVGEGGFGYDPVFYPDEGSGKTFAQMDATSKNAISHRGRAMAALQAYLESPAICEK